jgi:hypothetical protein
METCGRRLWHGRETVPELGGSGDRARTWGPCQNLGQWEITRMPATTMKPASTILAGGCPSGRRHHVPQPLAPVFGRQPNQSWQQSIPAFDRCDTVRPREPVQEWYLQPKEKWFPRTAVPTGVTTKRWHANLGRITSARRNHGPCLLAACPERRRGLADTWRSPPQTIMHATNVLASPGPPRPFQQCHPSHDFVASRQ